MTSTYKPKHRKNALVRKQPRLQPIGKHLGEYVPEDRILERLGAEAPVVRELSIADLLAAATVGNPFRGESA